VSTDEEELDEVACDHCGGAACIPLFPQAKQSHPPIVRCTGCGLCYLRRRLAPEALRSLYDADYFRSADSGAKGYDDYLADRVDILKTFHRRLSRIEKLTGGPGGVLLDVGCAAGFCLEAARERGWTPRGIEISEFAADAARSRGLEVTTGEFLPLTEELLHASLAVLTMWDYIEHVREPGAEIRRAHELLGPGGIFALATPDIGSLPARIFGAKWMGIKPEEHLTYFDRGSLRRYLEGAGFTIEEMRSTGKIVTLGFFARRVAFYSPRLGRLLTALLTTLRLDGRSLYVNPLDIVLVLARKS